MQINNFSEKVCGGLGTDFQYFASDLRKIPSGKKAGERRVGEGAFLRNTLSILYMFYKFSRSSGNYSKSSIPKLQFNNLPLESSFKWAHWFEMRAVRWVQLNRPLCAALTDDSFMKPGHKCKESSTPHIASR